MAEEVDCSEESLKTLFEKATSYVKKISSNITEEQLLQFYGYYKQAVEGQCLKPKPSWFQAIEKQKWKAWSSLNDMSREEAMRKYIELLDTLNSKWQDAPAEKTGSWVHHSSIKNTDEELDDSVKTIIDWVKEGNFTRVKSLTNKIRNINKLDEDGLTLLHWAADRGTLQTVKYLVQNLGANINVKDSEGQTALHYAAFCGHEDVVKFLLESGADATIKDNDDQTPYDIASGSNIKKILNVV